MDAFRCRLQQHPRIASEVEFELEVIALAGRWHL
jgi:hypothetical protein